MSAIQKCGRPLAGDPEQRNVRTQFQPTDLTVDDGMFGLAGLTVIVRIAGEATGARPMAVAKHRRSRASGAPPG